MIEIKNNFCVWGTALVAVFLATPSTSWAQSAAPSTPPYENVVIDITPTGIATPNDATAPTLLVSPAEEAAPENTSNTLENSRFSYPEEDAVAMPPRPTTSPRLPVVQAEARSVDPTPVPMDPPQYSYPLPVLDPLRPTYAYTSCEEAQAHARRPHELILKEGDYLHDRMRSWARSFGYTLHWDTQDYQIDNLVVLNDGFEENIAALLKGLDQNGIHLRAQIFSNCVLRISEEG